MNDFYDNGTINYRIQVNGQFLEGRFGSPVSTRDLADQIRNELPEDVREQAVIVPVNGAGQRMLFE